MKRAEYRSIVGSGRDVELLELVAWAGLLTTSQVAQLLFPSRRTAQRRLKACADHRLVRMHQQGALHLERFVTLTATGVEFLIEHGLGEESIRPGRAVRQQKLAHTLAIRQVFTEFICAEQQRGRQLDDFLFDGDLSRTEPYQSAGIVPDGLATRSTPPDGPTLTTAVEVDLGTETTKTLRRKLGAYGSIWRAEVATAPDDLLCVVRTDSRRRLIERLAQEAGIRTRTRVVRLTELPEVARECTRPVFAPTVRAARIAAPAQSSEFRPVSNSSSAAFRPASAGRRAVGQ